MANKNRTTAQAKKPTTTAQRIDTMTLEQKRAQDAWTKSKGCGKDYANYAKSLPALIMNSGLMQVLAFLHQKSSTPEKKNTHKNLSRHLRQWLHTRFPNAITSDSFQDVMESLQTASPKTYQDITTEAFAWLKWLRQMASARQGE